MTFQRKNLTYLKAFIFMFLLLFVVFYACKTPFEVNNFDSITREHKDIAILPFDIINTGIIPEGLTEEDLKEIEAAESRAFQISFYNEVLGSTQKGNRNLRVNVQPINQTNRVLEEHGLDGTDVLSYPYEEIAKMLEVDAVVTGQIQKNRLMSDLASYGIEIGVHILDVMSPHSIWPFIPGDLSRSKEIKSSYALYDGKESITLWSVSYDYDADWRRRANDIIDETNRRAARKFPYRL